MITGLNNSSAQKVPPKIHFPKVRAHSEAQALSTLFETMDVGAGENRLLAEVLLHTVCSEEAELHKE